MRRKGAFLLEDFDMAKAKISSQKILVLITRSDSRCEYCGQPFCQTSRLAAFSVDHATPRARGGTNDTSNLMAACMSCNMSKGTKTIEEYRELMRTRKAFFTDQQYDLLSQHGVKLPEELKPQPHKFYFELKRTPDRGSR